MPLGATPTLLSSDQTNLYEVIGLPQNASPDLIEEQCIRLGERYRSDKNSGDVLRARAFAQVERAYETLLDPVKRAAYDTELRREALAQDHPTSLEGKAAEQSASTPSLQLTTEQIARYRRAQGLTLLVIVSLAAMLLYLLYWLFKSDRTVDYYLNNYQERIQKIQECGQVPDITKDRECMNAITAQRMFMRR
jgi:curved DNA-binding protein CbpA